VSLASGIVSDRLQPPMGQTSLQGISRSHRVRRLWIQSGIGSRFSIVAYRGDDSGRCRGSTFLLQVWSREMLAAHTSVRRHSIVFRRIQSGPRPRKICRRQRAEFKSKVGTESYFNVVGEYRDMTNTSDISYLGRIRSGYRARYSRKFLFTRRLGQRISIGRHRDEAKKGPNSH